MNVCLILVETRARCTRCRCKLKRQRVAVGVPDTEGRSLWCVDCGVQCLSVGQPFQSAFAIELQVREGVQLLEESLFMVEEDHDDGKTF